MMKLNSTEAASAATLIETFMSSPIKDCSWNATPAEMLSDPVQDIGMADVAEEWLAQILESEDPECEFDHLINHLSGLLENVELIRKNYRQFIGEAA